MIINQSVLLSQSPTINVQIVTRVECREALESLLSGTPGTIGLSASFDAESRLESVVFATAKDAVLVDVRPERLPDPVDSEDAPVENSGPPNADSADADGTRGADVVAGADGPGDADLALHVDGAAGETGAATSGSTGVGYDWGAGVGDPDYVIAAWGDPAPQPDLGSNNNAKVGAVGANASATAEASSSAAARVKSKPKGKGKGKAQPKVPRKLKSKPAQAQAPPAVQVKTKDPLHDHLVNRPVSFASFTMARLALCIKRDLHLDVAGYDLGTASHLCFSTRQPLSPGEFVVMSVKGAILSEINALWDPVRRPGSFDSTHGRGERGRGKEGEDRDVEEEEGWRELRNEKTCLQAWVAFW
ncbi:hypothetical protein BOTBODRAFT_464258 [Botryobasidium botryosum FD-172 SS1]|uniref:Uncharacterized protein n=1 Tax=Botryobasidium botryosum (strain FD-172 SS1) TaxID=930990 RepID=A0A067M693_BOTB1|nr:hypothetical protein BOTBODRAFT_464258 [Botryobasidium botryosum FD-172 SS1]